MAERIEPSKTAGFWLVVGVLAAVGVIKVLNDTLDPDCFWHLRVAEQLKREGIGPVVDGLSFASIKQPWTPYSWLAEVGMKALWEAGGYRAAVVTSGVCAGAFLFLVALSCREIAGDGRGMNCVMGTALAACFSLPYMGFRPATIAMVLLALCAWLLLRDRRMGERSRAVWWIVPVTVVLVNVHLTAVVVPMAVGCLMVGAMVERTEGSVRRYALLLACCGVACLATPMLAGVMRAVWEYQFQDVMVASGGLEEMRPFYSTARGAAITSVAAMLLVVALINARRVRVGEWVWLAAGALLLLRLGRFAPIFALIAGPVLAAGLPAIPDAVLSRRILHVGTAVMLVLGLGLIVVLAPGRRTSMDQWLNRNGSGAFGYPCEAARFVECNVTPTSGRLINEFTWGGYLSWRLGDRYQVFVDGRTQLYTADFWRSTFLCDESTRAKTLSCVGADAAVLPVRDSVFRDALVKLGWRSAHRDGFAEVLVPPLEGYAQQ